ncbi:carbohydrate ABC transporter permease, partial [Bifidobacterium bifidum]
MTASITQAKGAAPKRAAAKPKRSKAFKRENRTGWAFMAPFAILFAFVFLLPIIWAVYSSFFRQVSQGGGLYGGGELVNEFVGFQNFQYVITSGKFWTGVGHVLLYTVIQVPIMIIAALALAMVIDSFV